MSQMTEGNVKSLPNGATALGRGLRVKLSSGVLALAGLTDREVGVLTARAESNDHAGVYLRSMAGTVQMVAADSFAVGAILYTAASGKVSDSALAGSFVVGRALEAASGDGAIVEVELLSQVEATAQGSHVATAGEATANAAAIDTGLGAVTNFIVQIYRGDVQLNLDQDISVSAGTITVADGASTYAVTAGDVINWWARA